MKTTWAKSVSRMLMTSAVAFIITCPAWSSGDVKIVPLSDGSKAAISLVGAKVNDAYISIENTDRTIQYYSAQVRDAEDYSKLFDFSHLEDGTYYFIAKVDGKTIRKSFTKEGNKVITQEMKEKEEQAYEPIFKKLNNTLICYFQNPDAKKVDVQFAANNNTFFTDSDKSGKIFFKRFDLSELPKGTYEVALSAGSYFYTYQLKLE